MQIKMHLISLLLLTGTYGSVPPPRWRYKDEQIGTVVLKNLLYSQFPRNERHNTTRRATRGRTRVGQEAEGAKGKCGKEPLLQFSWGKWAGGVGRFGIG